MFQDFVEYVREWSRMLRVPVQFFFFKIKPSTAIWREMLVTVQKRYWQTDKMAFGKHACQVIELLLKFGADPSGQHNGRQHLLEAMLQNRMWAFQLLLRSGASARGVQLSKYVQSLEEKLGMLNRADLLNHLPCFTWWGQDLPVEQLLKIRYSDLEAKLRGSGGAAALRLQTQIQVLEALQILVPLLVEDERLDVLASCVCLLRHLECHPEATHLSTKQPASLIQFKDFGPVQELEDADRVQSLALSDKWLASGSSDNRFASTTWMISVLSRSLQRLLGM